ncbi:MAG TPA: hypothetical protein DCS66_07830 [Flavobacteriaceae bacterium]|nr:hypothetical protein [Flavobacteriaceae bacterium]
MKKETKKDIIETLIGGAVAFFLIWLCSGCTTTQNEQYEESRAYQYYVIDINSDEPDAFFETKKEAESYKKYYEEHHTYKIVSIK